jgi:hypothetical protein
MFHLRFSIKTQNKSLFVLKANSFKNNGMIYHNSRRNLHQSQYHNSFGFGYDIHSGRFGYGWSPFDHSFINFHNMIDLDSDEEKKEEKKKYYIREHIAPHPPPSSVGSSDINTPSPLMQSDVRNN